MQRERQNRDDFFGIGDPFGGSRGSSMMPSLFGGKDPFDDPFFTRHFGGGIFDSSSFEHPGSGDTAKAYRAHSEKAVLIEELNSDDEEETEGTHGGNGKNNHGKYAISSLEPSIEHPDDGPADGNVSHKGDNRRMQRAEPTARSFSFQTSKVTYGGVNGSYYTSTRTRRAGTDGVMVEESKEADTTTGQATHRITRGIHDKGHSVTRKLAADGNVKTMQTLHNLNEDELTGFEEAWKGNGLSGQSDIRTTTGFSSRRQEGMPSRGGWALPSIDRLLNTGVRGPDNEARSSGGGTKKVVRTDRKSVV